MNAIASSSHLYNRYANAVAGDIRGAIPLRQRAQPKLVGGKIVIAISEEEYAWSLVQLRWCLIGRLVLAKGERPISTKELKRKLSEVWGVNSDSWFITPMGRGFSHWICVLGNSLHPNHDQLENSLGFDNYIAFPSLTRNGVIRLLWNSDSYLTIRHTEQKKSVF